MHVAGNIKATGTLAISGYSDVGSAISSLTSGGISKSGTPVDNQVAVFTSANEVEGSSNLTFASNVLTVGGDITATGTITAQEFKTEFVSSSIVFESGSTIFGNSTDDTHTFTGNVNISGSSTSSLFTVDGTQGRLFSVTDELSGSLFSANTIAGLPVIEAFSDNKVTLGPYSNPVTVTGTGNVGIGNSSPVDLLHVGAGADSPAVDSVAIFTHTGTTNVAIRDASSDVELLNYAYSGGGLIGTVTNHDLSIRTNNTNKLTITSGGNVSIGTTATYGNLTVGGTGEIIAGRASSGAGSFSMYEAGTTRFMIESLNGSGGMAFKVPSTEAMRIDSSGNVSIGNAKGDSITTNTELAIYGGEGADAILQLLADNADNTADYFAMRQLATGNFTMGHHTGGGFNDALVIAPYASGNNVGIGDTNPSEKLDISGGHINIDNNYGYKIGGNRFLLYNGTDTFIGDVDGAGGTIYFREDGSTKMTIQGGNVQGPSSNTHCKWWYYS